jgi:hypothetical protein
MKKTVVIAVCSILLGLIFSITPSTRCLLKTKDNELKRETIKCYHVFEPNSAVACESPSDGPDEASPSGSASLLTVFLAFVLISYLFGTVCIFLIIRKLNVPHSWLALVPVAQAWSIVAAAGKPWWLVILIFIPYINIIAVLYLWGFILEKLGKHPALTLLFLLPVVNILFLGMLAFSRKKTTQNIQPKKNDEENR